MPLRSRIALGVIISIAAFLRLYHLDGYGLWSDEFVTLMTVSSRSYGELIKTCFEIPQPMPPLYFLLNKLVFDMLPANEVGLRLVSALAAIASTYVVFVLGRSLFNTETGLYGSLLFAINSTQIVYAQNARPYALSLLLSGLSMLFFVRWLRHKSGWDRVAYISTTVLLFYTHYIFFPLVVIQTLYLFWVSAPRRGRAGERAGQIAAGSPAESHQSPPEISKNSTPAGSSSAPKSAAWRSWLWMQIWVVVLLVPLFPQLWRVVEARQSLNWERKYPAFSQFFVFFHPNLLLWSVFAGLLAFGLCLAGRREWHAAAAATIRTGWSRAQVNGFVLLGLWYLTPVSLFFFLARWNGINLFVERYLILASVPVVLLLPAAAFQLPSRVASHVCLLAYFGLYAARVPGHYFVQKGQVSQGVPGGNEWRETLRQLESPDFRAPLFLFQSPFIESNQLNFNGNDRLLPYLSSPLRSFYVKDVDRPFVLLPVHWWVDNPSHQQFKAQMARLMKAQPEFVLLSTQEFWNTFEPWFKQAFGNSEWAVTRSFRSSGALRLRRIRWQ
jgi:hypothetical protein